MEIVLSFWAACDSAQTAEFFLLSAWNFPSSVRVLSPLFTSCMSKKSLILFSL